jgi:alginate O-acetyltransferase complex protein AlgI
MPLASYAFVLAFLPLVLIVQRGIGRAGPRAATLWLCTASLAFCAWAGALSLVVLLGSSVACFACSRWIVRRSEAERSPALPLGCGVALQLLLLGYFKYAGFVTANLRALFGDSIPLIHALLPLGLSFISFQQIAYLVDAQRGATREDRFLDFLLLVSFFPKLVAGPIAEASKLTAQLRAPGFGRIDSANLVVGFTLIGAGLFKKVVIADRLGVCADAVFGAARQAEPLAASSAWLGALAYSLQLYFDFSGYSDMALGAARCFGIVLPLNFYSPFQATSIAEFWRRWHITLGRFLTRYLYTPLATPLTRWAVARQLVAPALFATSVALPTLLTFTLAGLWHGAGWTFVIFGALHGLYLTVQQGWRELRRALLGRPEPSALRSLCSWALTFVAVLIAFVVFRAETSSEALRVLGAMLGAGADVTQGELLLSARDLRVLAAAALLAFLAPNTAQWLRAFEPALDIPKGEPPIPWPGPLAPGAPLAFATALVWLVALGTLGEVSAFLYYRF